MLQIACSQVFLKGSKEIEINGHETGTAGSMVCNYPAVAPQPGTSPVGSMMPDDFHLFGLLKKHLATKQFTADADGKQTVTWLQTLEIDFYVMIYKPWCHRVEICEW